MLADERIAVLARLVTRSPSEIYDHTYATLPRCSTCGRALADDDCERDDDLPEEMRMCFALCEPGDSTCRPGLRVAPSGAA